MYIENFWGGRGSSKYYHGYIEGGWGYESPKNVLRSMWLIPKYTAEFISFWNNFENLTYESYYHLLFPIIDNITYCER